MFRNKLIGAQLIPIYAIFMLVGFYFSEGYVATFLSVVTFLIVSSYVEKNSSVHMMFYLGYCTFIFLPALINWYYLGVSYELFYISSFISLVFLYLTRGTLVRYFKDYGNISRFIFVVSCFCAAFLLLIDIDVRPFFVTLIVLMSLSFKQNNFKNNFIFLIFFLMIYVLFAFLSWSGFGRVVVLGWLILALLQFAYANSFSVNKFVFGLLPGLSASLITSRDLLKIKFSGFEHALYDSAYGPYRLAASFIDNFKNNGIDFNGFLDQIIFTFFVFVPRVIWQNKPNGFGYEYTVRHLDQYLADAGHSIASTLIGDHIYFLGYWGVLSALIIFYLIAKVVNFLYKIKFLNGNAVLLVSASMMVLVWGGMTSFSARVALPSIVFIIVLVVLNRFFIKKVKFVWGS